MLKKLYITFIAAFFVFALALLNNPPAFYGFSAEKTAYIGSESSQAVIEDFGALEFVNGIKGESCRVKAENFDLDAVIKNYSAEIIKVERVAGTVSYYFFSPVFKNSVTIGGEKINLHIAVNNEQVTMGTPLIYGSY